MVEKFNVVNIKEKFAKFSEYWTPKIAAELNGQQIKFAKLKGEFFWHFHENEDELFLVIKGKLIIRLREQDITINEGEFFIVPKGVEHLPIAEEECHVMLIEPASTLNTGNINNDITLENLENI